MEAYYTTRTLAQHYGFTEQFINQLANRGELPGFRLGTAWRFPVKDVELWQRERIEQTQNRKKQKENEVELPITTKKTK